MAGEGRLVAILGVGTIGESLLRGLLSGDWREPSELVVTVRDEHRAVELAERYGVRATTSNAEGVPVVRSMPNRPATVHEGIAGVCAGAHAGDENLTLAEEALSHLGRVVRVPERYMDAVTAVSGSGPAYFALLAEAMIEAGILLGLSREVSTQL